MVMRALFLLLVTFAACERAPAGLPLGKHSGHRHLAERWDKDPIVEDLKNVPTLAEMRRYGITYDDQVARTKALLAILERHDLSALSKVLTPWFRDLDETGGSDELCTLAQYLNRITTRFARFSRPKFTLQTDTLRWSILRAKIGKSPCVATKAKALYVATFHDEADGQEYSGTYGIEIRLVWSDREPHGLVSGLGFLPGSINPVETKQQSNQDGML
jgi:hypothetical protein